MAKWNKIVITNAGYQLSAATLAGNTISYTRAQTTDKDMSGLTSEQLKEITKLESVAQDLPLGTVSVQDDHTVNVPIKVMNSDLQEDYLLYGIAIFAKIEGGEEILYGIATSVNPDLIPAQNGSTVVGTTFKVKLHVGDAANVTIVVSPDGSVSNEELESILNNYVLTSDLDKLIAEKIPDTLTDSTKAEHITGPWDFDHATMGGKELVTTDSLAESLPEGILTADNIAASLPSDLVYSDKDVTVSGQFTFDKAPKLSNGATLSTSDDIQKLVDQIAALQKLVGDLVKIVPLSQTEYDALVAAGTVDTTAMYITWEG